MVKELGAMLITLGMLLVLSAWGARGEDTFLFDIIFGPMFIYLGFKLLV